MVHLRDNPRLSLTKLNASGPVPLNHWWYLEANRVNTAPISDS